MKPAELDRLRALLRENDPAAGVEGPTREQAERLRRAVLTALPAPAAGAFWLGLGRGSGAPRWAVAAAAVVALLAAGGAMVVRVGDERPADLGAARRPVRQAVPPAPAAMEPHTDGATPSPPATDEARLAALAGRDRALPPAGGEPRPPRASAAPAAGESAGDAPPPAVAPSEDLAIAALPAPLGRQIQVTAPGGTRIVWILTPSTGP